MYFVSNDKNKAVKSINQSIIKIKSNLANLCHKRYQNDTNCIWHIWLGEREVAKLQYMY